MTTTVELTEESKELLKTNQDFTHKWIRGLESEKFDKILYWSPGFTRTLYYLFIVGWIYVMLPAIPTYLLLVFIGLICVYFGMGCVYIFNYRRN